MALDKTRLREQIVLMERVDTLRGAVDAAGYQAAARAVRETIERDLWSVPMRAFVNAVLPSLEATAQNVFFEAHGRFADLDGSGCARKAQQAADRFLRRL